MYLNKQLNVVELFYGLIHMCAWPQSNDKHCGQSDAQSWDCVLKKKVKTPNGY